jgi:hypothetical protein
VPAHSGFGFITLLFQHNVGGLAVPDSSTWNDAMSSAKTEVKSSSIGVELKAGMMLIRGEAIQSTE